MARLVVRALVALGLAVLALGVALVPLQIPAYTRTLSARFSNADSAELPRAKMLQVAEGVREFVVQGRGTLPAQVEGREGFDASAVAHLVDVSRVLARARAATALIAVALGVWMALAWRAGRHDEVAKALGLGAVLTVVLPLAAAAVGALDFEGFFAMFHGLFFADGTWTFPADSLLIETFPEPFWMLSGAAWGMGVLVIAGLYAASWAVLRRR